MRRHDGTKYYRFLFAMGRRGQSHPQRIVHQVTKETTRSKIYSETSWIRPFRQESRPHSTVPCRTDSLGFRSIHVSSSCPEFLYRQSFRIRPATYSASLASISRSFSSKPQPATASNRGSAPPTHSSQQANKATPLPFSAIPGPSGIAQWPIIGTLRLFKPFTKFTTTTAHEMLDDLFQRFGPIVRCQLRGPTVLVRDIKDVEAVFRNEGQYPVRPSLELQADYAKRNSLKEGFNEVQGEAWYKLRAPLNKCLARVNSATYYMQDQNSVADDFRDILESGSQMTPAELGDTFFRFSAESIGVVCFNNRLGFLEPDYASNPKTADYLRASKAVFRLLHDEVMGRSLMHRFYRNKTYREFEAAQLTIKYYSGLELEKANKVLKQRQQDGVFDPEESNLLFSLLSNPDLDFDDIQNLMNTLYTTGTDSTAKNLQVLFYNLAANPDKQDMLYKEITDVLGPDQPLTPETLMEMPYLRAAVKESFRMNFPLLGVLRCMPKDFVLGGYLIPAGTQILICSISVARSYFQQPLQYIPERWLRTDQGKRLEKDLHPMAILPFGYGPRNCIGRRFAEQEIKIATVKVLQKMKIGLKPESEDTRFTYSLFIEPEKPIAFTFSRR